MVALVETEDSPHLISFENGSRQIADLDEFRVWIPLRANEGDSVEVEVDDQVMEEVD